MKTASKMMSLDDNPYEVGDRVKLFTTKKEGVIVEVLDDFCKVELVDGQVSTFEHTFLRYVPEEE